MVLQVDPNPIWVKGGNFYTCAGISSGIDLALALVGEDLGNDAALEVAKNLVLFLRRPGGQAQFSVALQAQRTPGLNAFVRSEAERLATDQFPFAFLILFPDLEVLDFGWNQHTAIHRLSREVVADQCHITVHGDLLVQHLQFVKAASTGLDVGDKRFLVLDSAVGMPVGQVVSRQGLQFGDVLVPHGLGQLVHGSGNILLTRRWRSRHVSTEQAQKTNKQFDVFHHVSLLL
jgi:hypothetical protein